MNMQNHGAFDFRIVPIVPQFDLPPINLIDRLPSRIELFRYGKASSEAIIDATAVASGYRRAEILAHSRRTEYVRWRVACYETIRWLVPTSSNCSIARRFNRDFTTVWYARWCYKQNPAAYEEQIHAIREVLIFNHRRGKCQQMDA